MSGRRTVIRNQISTEISRQGSVAANQPQTTNRTRSARANKSKGRIKSSTIAVYASVFVLLVVLIAIGYRAPQEVSGVANTAPITSENAIHTENTAINEVVSSNIAASVATATNLAVAPSVTSLAISTQIESELPSSDDSSISKPQIIQVSSASRKITNYTVAAGDTTDSIAAKFGISKTTLKWANNLSSDNLTVGKSLDILPRDGIAYTVKSGDTAQGIADKYKSDASTIVTFNDLEISGVTPGLKIIVPNGQLPNTEQPGYTAPISTLYAGYSSGNNSGRTWSIRIGTPMYAGNNYAVGNCTAYVFDRRVELGNPVRPSWGNAVSWAAAARSAGYVVNNTPSVGSVIQNGGGAGHVAIVEKILDNGDLELSEMNYGGGWNLVSGRILPAANISQYLYIH
ncbi:MAG: LysM peptidoglycan-binding domain-containing protein [Candidatus Microsaccharimonas sp.]